MWSIAGNEAVVAGLERALAENRLAHAYLINGPAHTGKHRLAIDLAKALNCQGSDPPCSVCTSCRRIEAGLHPDVEIVDIGGLCDESDHDHARDGSKDIKICQIRRVERIVALKPFEGRNRVIIIERADSLNAYAADALLKTLEEPPEQVVIVLLSVEPASLPETIVSRARRIVLTSLPTGRIREELIGRGIEPERATLLSRLSDGRIGWAIAHAGDQTLLDERDEQLAQLDALLRERLAVRMRLAAELAALFGRSRDDVYARLELWTGYFRDLLLVSEGCEDLVAGTDRLAGMRKVVGGLAPAAIVKALAAFRDCRRQLENNANARLALEVLLMRLPRPAVLEEVRSPAQSLSSD
jgi:DNA polymerase III subunit delta'